MISVSTTSQRSASGSAQRFHAAARIEETQVKGRVVNDQLGAVDKGLELPATAAKRGLSARKVLVMPWTSMAPASMSRSGLI
jgi:hypothetical protein